MLVCAHAHLLTCGEHVRTARALAGWILNCVTGDDAKLIIQSPVPHKPPLLIILTPEVFV